MSSSDTTPILFDLVVTYKVGKFVQRISLTADAAHVAATVELTLRDGVTVMDESTGPEAIKRIVIEKA